MQFAVGGRACGHLHGSDAEAPYVRLGIVSLVGGLNHLGRHPERSAGESLALVSAEGVGHLAGDAEVGETNLGRGAQKHVRRLDVAVDLALAMEVVERHEEVTAHDRDGLLGKGRGLEKVRNRPAGHVLHRDCQTSRTLVHPRAQVLGHVPAVDLHQRGDLPLNVLHFILRILEVHELDRDHLTSHAVDCAVDIARVAAPNATTQLEALARERHPAGRPLDTRAGQNTTTRKTKEWKRTTKSCGPSEQVFASSE